MPPPTIRYIAELLKDKDVDPNRKIKVRLVAGDKFGKLTVLFLLKTKLHKKHTAYACVCDCGNYIAARVDNLISKRTTSCGCVSNYLRKHCNRKLPEAEMIRQITDNTIYSVVDTGDKRANGKWVFNCPRCGNNFIATWRSVKRNKSNCSCGGGGGYKSSKQGNLYVLNIIDNGVLIAIKIGITNKNVEDRVKALKQDTTLVIEVHSYFTFDDGFKALEIESFIKQKYPCYFLSKEIFGTGYTETISPVYLPYILKDIKSKIEKEL